MSFVTLDNYIVIAETRLAVGVAKARSRSPEGGGKSLLDVRPGEPNWIPRSVCDGGSILEKGDTDIVVQEWFAEKEGLDY